MGPVWWLAGWQVANLDPAGSPSSLGLGSILMRLLPIGAGWCSCLRFGVLQMSSVKRRGLTAKRMPDGLPKSKNKTHLDGGSNPGPWD
jgi:hypothetical protein